MKRLLAVLLFALAAAARPACAEIRIDVTRGTVEPLPIALTDFYGSSKAETDAGHQITSVVATNLENSGIFRIIDPKAFIQTAAEIRIQPRFADWRIIGAQALVAGSVATEADGRLRVEFRLWDVFAGQQLSGKAYMTQPDNWRRIAHIISDEIYKRITGETGYFDTRIVYVAESGPPNKRVKRLAIMDQDGYNSRYLTDGKSLVMTPRFSPVGPLVTYLSYGEGRKPRVYLYNIDTGRQEVLGSFPGMTFAPRFSPDGKSVVMSQSTNGDSDIYLMNLASRKVRQLTTAAAIDTSPCFSPDGSKIAFESDRGGTQQLYVMDAGGGSAKRISFGEGRYATPVWSPRGDLIAFIKMLGGQFYLGVMHPDGSGERLITKSYHLEGPTWSPNGRVLMYFKEATTGAGGRDRSAKLYAIDLTGVNERYVKTPIHASDPAWSPLIP